MQSNGFDQVDFFDEEAEELPVQDYQRRGPALEKEKKDEGVSNLIDSVSTNSNNNNNNNSINNSISTTGNNDANFQSSSFFSQQQQQQQQQSLHEDNKSKNPNPEANIQQQQISTSLYPPLHDQINDSLSIFASSSSPQSIQSSVPSTATTSANNSNNVVNYVTISHPTPPQQYQQPSNSSISSQVLVTAISSTSAASSASAPSPPQHPQTAVATTNNNESSLSIDPDKIASPSALFFYIPKETSLENQASLVREKKKKKN